jgi:hypothetical protein
MAWHRNIYFDDPLVDEVLLAVEPIDAFTGQIVQGPVECEIKDFPCRPIRNRSGLYVFLSDTQQQDAYHIRIKAQEVGYFDKAFDFRPPDPDASIAEGVRARRVVVPLLRRPTMPYTDSATLISGVVVRGEEPVVNADLWVDLPDQPLPDNPPADTQFRTLTDERGAFSLALRVPDSTVTVTMHINDETAHRSISGVVEEHGRHSFKKPIDFSIPADPNFTWEPSRSNS